MKAIHYIILVLSGLVSVCQFVGQQWPAEAALAAAIAGIAASLMGTLGILSPGATASAPAPAPSAAPAALPAGVQNAVSQATATGVAALQASAAPVVGFKS